MEHGIYLNGIKTALRARGLTYGDLAGHLKMTESGVKKMLNAKDISFRRLIQICDVLNVLPGQLFSLSEQSSIPVVRLSDKQQDALLKNRDLLTVYWRFTVEKKTLEEIMALHGYSPQDLRKILQKLVSHDLVKQKRGRFFPKDTGKFRWPDDSLLAKTLNAEWSQLTLRRALSRESDGMHRLTALKLSRKSYDELMVRLASALDEAVLRSEREELATSQKSLQDFVVLIASSRGVFAT